jgi:integrase
MPRNLKKRGNVWWYRLTNKGTTYEGTLQTEHLGLAKDRFEAVKRELKGTRFGERPRRTFDEAARRFKSEHFSRLRPKAAKRYVVSLLALADHLHGRFLDDIGSAALGDFERARLAKGVTTATVRRDLACLSSLYSRAEEWEWVTFNPVKPYKRGRAKAGLKEGQARTRYWSVEEEEAGLAAASPKSRDVFAFLIDTGLRKDELASLLLTDVALAAQQVIIRAEVSKSGRSRIVPLLPRALEIAKRQAGERVGAVPLFVTVHGERYSRESPTWYEALQKACRRANLKQTSLHDLRRTCGCRLIQDHGMPIEKVSQWLGHADVRITQQRYAFLRAEDLHRAIRPANVVDLKIERTK